MADFTPYTPKKPVVVDRLDIVLTHQRVEGGEDTETIDYQAYLRDEDGHIVSHPFGSDRGDLAPFMTASQITTAKAFLNAMYTKAQKLIP